MPRQQKRRHAEVSVRPFIVTPRVRLDNPFRALATTSQSPGEAAVLAMERFETETSAAEEDAVRLAGLAMVLPIVPPLGWLSRGPKLAFARHLERHPLSSTPAPTFRRETVLALQAKLASTGEAPHLTLASAVAMRALRVVAIGAVLDALADIPDEDLCTVTVVKPAWVFTPSALAKLSAATLKMQLEGDLKRTGTYQQPGPLVAFLHGEWEPTNGVYVLHYHLVTTRKKAAYMLKRFREMRDTFKPTALVKRPLRVSKIKNRVGQLTYLLKSYWPRRALRRVDGIWKRERLTHRMSEPYSSAYLLWLDRHRLLDLTIMNGTWSNKLGGSAEWKRFYLIVIEHGRGKRRRRRKTSTAKRLRQ